MSRTRSLCRDPNAWQLLTKRMAEHMTRQDDKLSAAEHENTRLREENLEAQQTNKMLQTRYNNLVLDHRSVRAQLRSAKRKLGNLKKSERQKSGVEQHNLRLKSTLKRVLMGDKSAGGQQSLREALAAATEQIAELVRKGGAVLDALELLNNSEEEDVDGEGDCGMSSKPSLLEVEAAFRSVLEDGAFAERREKWKGLLGE